MTTYSFIDESGETRLRGTIDPAPGGGSQTLEEVLTEGNDAASQAITGLGAVTLDGSGDLDAGGANVVNAPNLVVQGSPLSGDLDMGGNGITNVALIVGTGEDFDTGGGNLALGGATITGAHTAILGDLARIANAGPVPELPHVPVAQDIADALLALGLVTQG